MYDYALTNTQLLALLVVVLVAGWLLTTTLPEWRERRHARRGGCRR